MKSARQYAAEHNIEVDQIPLFSLDALSVEYDNGCCAIAIDPNRIESYADENTKIAHGVNPKFCVNSICGSNRAK